MSSRIAFTLAVTLDVGPAVHQRAGLSRYTERLAATLLAWRRDEIDLCFFYNAHSGHALPPSLAAGYVQTLRLGQYAWRLSVLAGQIARAPYLPLLAGGCDPSRLYHATEHLLPRLPGPTVLTVHDLIFERYPEHHTWTNRLFLRVGMPLFVRAAHQIIAVSRQTARDLAALYQVDPHRIHVVYNGVDATYRPPTGQEQQAIRARYSPERPYLLMVGTLEPRKNHALALAALARLKAAGHPHRLIIAGGQGWLFAPIQRLVEELGLAEDVSFSGYVPETDLPALLGAADCVLVPSLYEGFGLPVIEAMACGAPVVCANASSLPEVADDAALLIPVHDADALAAAIHLVLTQPALAAELRQRGLRRANHFTWEKCARQTVEVYRAAYESASPA
jgi:glycosyltransferase involved in cell wall biosynthesis